MNSSYDEQHSNWPWHANHHHQPWLLPPGPGPSLQWSSTTATVHNLLFVSARGWGRRENVSNLPLIPNWCVFCFILKYYHVLSIHTCCQWLTCSWSCHQPPPVYNLPYISLLVHRLFLTFFLHPAWIYLCVSDWLPVFYFLNSSLWKSFCSTICVWRHVSVWRRYV